MRRLVAAIVMIGLAATAMAAPARKVDGYVAQGPVRLKLVDGFAVRGARGEKVTVHLFPVPLDDNDLARGRAGQAWSIALRKPSPNRRQWDWCPTVDIDMQSLSGPLRSRANLTFANFMFTGLDRRNHTVNLNRSGEQARASLSTLEFSQSGGSQYVTLDSRARSLSYDGKTTYSWRIHARLPVLQQAGDDND